MSEFRHRIHACLWMVAATVAFLTLALVDAPTARGAAPIYPAVLLLLWAAERTFARRHDG